MLYNLVLQRWHVNPPDGKLDASGSPFTSSLPEKFHDNFADHQPG